MDSKGHIRHLEPGEQPRPDEILIEKDPNPKCKDCYGRGHIRYIILNKVKIGPCHCVGKIVIG